MPMVEKRDRGRSRDSGNDSMQEISKMCLEALPVDDGWSGFIVDKDARIDPPIHTEYFLSGGAIILIFMVDGARAVISFCILSAIPGYMVVPPERTVLAYKSLRISTSHFMIELYVVSWIPQASIPKKDGWKRASGQRNLSLPIVIT
ncbi:unnamed protein product [Heterotrigona itama]|uniref:Uncharacterized protein n=1 Tax=Heterotrigona itama TaxID=395501 RepID=A0A6V7GZA4_9HYME|nr:unnamed protein product [Heterotrigona itama]